MYPVETILEKICLNRRHYISKELYFSKAANFRRVGGWGYGLAGGKQQIIVIQIRGC